MFDQTPRKPFSLGGTKRRIYERLKKIGPGPADRYYDVCLLLEHDQEIKTVRSLVGHLFREIESAIRSVLELEENRVAGQEMSTDVKSGIRKPLEKLANEIENYLCDAQDDLSVVEKALRSALGLMGGGHKLSIKNVLRVLGIDEKDPHAEWWINGSGEFHKIAHRDALGPVPPPDGDFRNWWNDAEALMDFVLDRFEANYLKYHEVIEPLIKKATPSDDDIRVLRNNVPHNQVTLKYFFENVGPGWLVPLKRKGYFRNPPDLETDAETGRSTGPLWPQADYLVRMAEKEPEIVRNIIQEMPRTENPWLLIDLLPALLAMPIEISASLVSNVKSWLETPYLFPHGDKFGQFMVKLATAGYVDHALDLAKSVLAISPPPAEAKDREPITRFRMSRYRDILRNNVPKFIEAAGTPALNLLCELLQRAAEPDASGVGENSTRFRFYSDKDEEDNMGGHLVTAVRKAAESLIEKKGKSVIEIIETRKHNIFTRIGLHLRRLHWEIDPEGTEKIVLNKDLIKNYDVEYEYESLVYECFPRFSSEAKEEYQRLVDEGLDTSKLKLCLSTEQIAEHVARWRSEKLDLIEQHLDGPERERIESLRRDLGVVQPHRPKTGLGEAQVSCGWPSPRTTAELASMSIEDMISYLKDYKPAPHETSLSVSGLAETLRAVVSGSPQRYAEAILQFRVLPPTYCGQLLLALSNAVKQVEEFAWDHVVQFCQWAVEQRTEPVESRQHAPWGEMTWQDVRRCIADLLERGFEDGRATIPFELRESCRQILEVLTEDLEPTPDMEADWLSRSSNPTELSINSTRGMAMHASVMYALWVRRHLAKEPDGEERISRGFAEMPEVQRILDLHLDRKDDPALAVRSVYGRWFPWLLLMDRNWTEKNLERIFPHGDAQHDLWNAAWTGYIAQNYPDDSVWEVLHGEYDIAVQRMDTSFAQNRAGNPDQGLAFHLLIFCGREKVDLNDPNGILARFYRKASPSVRGHNLWTVQHALHDPESGITPNIIEKWKSLWEWRIAEAEGADSVDPYVEEIKWFGWWFTSEKLDDKWRLGQLKRVLKLHSDLEHGEGMVEKLASLVDKYPEDVLRCLTLMVKDDRWYYHVNSWRQEIRTILSTTLSSSDATVRTIAEELLSRLGSEGHIAFRDLWTGAPTDE